MNSQQFITGGITIEGDAITTMPIQQLDNMIRRELNALRRDLIKEAKKMKGKR